MGPSGNVCSEPAGQPSHTCPRRWAGPRLTVTPAGAMPPGGMEPGVSSREPAMSGSSRQDRTVLLSEFL